MNTIKKAYKYRFYPNNEQKEQLEKTFGCTRFVYNHFLKIRTHEWFENQKRVGYNETAGLLVSLKKEKDFEWLKEVPSVCLQQALQNLDNAFKNFFQKRAKYPTFKKKKSSQSARYTTSGFTYKNGVIKLAKHSKPLDIKWSRKFNGNPSSVTVSKDSSGRYHISILVEEKIELKNVIKNEIGLDLGLSHAVITSEGEKINNQRFFKNDEKKLAKAAKNEDVLNNQFLLDATFLGEYRDETMEIINRLVELNNGSFHASKDDMEILKEAAYWYREVSKTKEL